jgi:hypothetical protein
MWAWLWAVACTGAVPDDPVETGTAVTWPAPTVVITAPTDGQVVGPEGFDATVALTGFPLVPKDPVGLWVPPLPLVPWGWVSTAAYAHEVNEAPEGYVSWSVDQTVVVEAAAETVRIDTSALAPGEHTLWAELFYPDGDFFYPPILDHVSFTVAEPPPAGPGDSGDG